MAPSPNFSFDSNSSKSSKSSQFQRHCWPILQGTETFIGNLRPWLGWDVRKGEKAKGACCCNKLKPCGNCATPVSLAGWLPAHLLQGIVSFIYIKRMPHPLWHFTSPISPSFLQFAGPCFSSISDIECHQSVCLQSPKNMFSMQWCTWDRAKEHIVRLICAAVHMNVGHNIHCKDETTCRIMIPCIHEVQCYLKCETTREQTAADSILIVPMVLLQTCDIPILPQF